MYSKTHSSESTTREKYVKTLSQAGIGVLPWIQPRSILGVQIEVTNATTRMGRSPQGEVKQEVVFSCRLLEDAFFPDGNAVPLAFWMSMDANEPRLQFVRHFEQDSESLGPVVIQQLAPTTPGTSGAFAFMDAEHLVEGSTQRASSQALPAASTRPATTVTAPIGQRPAARHVDTSPPPKGRAGAGASPSRSGGNRASSASDDDGEVEDLPF